MTPVKIIEDSVPEEGTSVMGGQTFEEAAMEMPDNAASGFGTVTPPPTGEDAEGFGLMGEGGEEEPRKAAVKMTRKMKAAMKKIQARVTSTPILWFRAKAAEHAEWALDQDEEEIIKESLGFVFDVLNIEFRIETLDITLQSIWWVFLYPVAAIGMIWMTHKGIVDAKYKEETPEVDKDAK